MGYDYDRYQRYIASSAFRRLRDAVWERCGGKCERCIECPMEHTAHHCDDEHEVPFEPKSPYVRCRECYASYRDEGVG